MLDVLHSLVHTQEDGLMTVIQTRGGTLCACTQNREDKATAPSKQLLTLPASFQLKDRIRARFS